MGFRTPGSTKKKSSGRPRSARTPEKFEDKTNLELNLGVLDINNGLNLSQEKSTKC